jgi:putative DNA-invertase from lambdoid prophage Rac
MNVGQVKTNNGRKGERAMTKTEVNQVNQGEKRGRGRPRKATQEVKNERQAVGYIRVSTERQEYDAQRSAINEAAASEGYKVTFHEETVSSRKEERGIHEIVRTMEAGTVIITYEASRLARNMIELAAIVQEIKNKKCGLWIISENIKIGLSDAEDIHSEFMLMALGLAAQIERKMISERTRNALAHKKKEGVILGRPQGRGRKVAEAIEQKGLNREYIMNMRKAGLSVAKLAKMAGVNRLTMDEFIKSNI